MRLRAAAAAALWLTSWCLEARADGLRFLPAAKSQTVEQKKHVHASPPLED